MYPFNTFRDNVAITLSRRIFAGSQQFDLRLRGKIIYFNGFSSAGAGIGSFLFGWPSIIALIVNYIHRGDARGSWLESHFDWQIRTFWYGLAWALLVGLVSLPLTLVVIGFATWAVACSCSACGPSRE